MITLKESKNWFEIIKRLSLSTPPNEVNFMINNIFNDKYMQRIFKLLGREDNSEGYPLPGKEGIDYADASEAVKKSILQLIKQDASERP
jgi:hypothetical protein